MNASWDRQTDMHVQRETNTLPSPSEFSFFTYLFHLFSSHFAVFNFPLTFSCHVSSEFPFFFSFFLGGDSCDGPFFGPEVDRASDVVEEFAINLHRSAWNWLDFAHLECYQLVAHAFNAISPSYRWIHKSVLILTSLFPLANAHPNLTWTATCQVLLRISHLKAPTVYRGVYNWAAFDFIPPPPAFDFLPRDALRQVKNSMVFFPTKQKNSKI